MSIKHAFTTSNTIGGIGESLFLMFANQTLNSEIQNVTRIKKWQTKGIDFIIDKVKYDVKFDIKAASTGNLAFETVSKKKDDVVEKKGWAYTSTADCIVYVTLLDNSWVLMFFTPDEIRSLIEKYAEFSKSVYNYGYTSEVILVPLEDLEYKKKAEIPIIGALEEETKDLLKFVHTHIRRKLC